ncbi:NLRC3, partial [Symbiodinium microadriaticum]
ACLQHPSRRSSTRTRLRARIRMTTPSCSAFLSFLGGTRSRCRPAAPSEAKEYDLADKNGLADFLEDADIQLGGPGTRRISKDALRVIVRNLKGDRFTVDMLQDILQEVVPDRWELRRGAAELRGLGAPPPPPGSSSAAAKGWSMLERVDAWCLCIFIQCDVVQRLRQSKRYDLTQKQGLADFLKDADIRLVHTPGCSAESAKVRADFILKLHREGQRLPRRQEAESAYVDCRTALVTHEEVQFWADGQAPDGTQVISVSHCWESREHCDPYGYQVSKLAKALTGEEWLFIDYVSLYQFQRLSQQQNLSFRRSMQHMHVLYCHDATSTLRIESLTPEADIAEAERNQDSVTLYHLPTGLVKPVPVCELVKNRTPYGERGWCAAEREWSSTRAATNLSREVDSPEGEKGGMAPMLPEAFRQIANKLKFTHTADAESVCRLQAEVYKEKAEMCKSLRLVDLGAEALDIALSALEHYPVLESLEIIHGELGPKLPLLLKTLEKIKLRQLHLQQNELFEEGTRQVIEALALQSNGTLAALSLAHERIGVANVKALAEALRTNRALIELNLSHACLSIDGIIALAEAIKENRTLKQLSLAGSKIGEEGAFALLEALRISGVERRLDLRGCDWGDLGKAKVKVALARALRTGQVKGTITHPAVEFLSKLEDAQLRQVEEAQKLELDLDGDVAKFRELFALLCRALPELPKLRGLVLLHGFHGSRFGDDKARALAAGLGQQKELERLVLGLSGNSLCREGAKAVTSALALLTELKELRLHLSGNRIGDAVAAAVADSLHKLRQLTKVRVGLRNNALGEEGGKAVASALALLTELKELSLHLGENRIGDAGAAAVAESLCNLRQLTKLDVQLPYNALGDASATAVVESLPELPQLTELVVELHDNALSEEEKKKLRATFDALPVRKKRMVL